MALGLCELGASAHVT